MIHPEKHLTLIFASDTRKITIVLSSASLQLSCIEVVKPVFTGLRGLFGFPHLHVPNDESNT